MRSNLGPFAGARGEARSNLQNLDHKFINIWTFHIHDVLINTHECCRLKILKPRLGRSNDIRRHPGDLFAGVYQSVILC